MTGDETRTVARAVDEWEALRADIREATADHPRHLCWLCGVRTPNVTLPGLPVRACRECDAAARAEAADA